MGCVGLPQGVTSSNLKHTSTDTHTHAHTHAHRLPLVAVASVLQSPNSARCKCVVNALWHSGGGSSTGSENEAILKSTGAAAAQPGKVVSAFTAWF